MAVTRRAARQPEPSGAGVVTKDSLHRRIDELSDETELLEAARLLDKVGEHKPSAAERALIQRWIEPHPRGSYRARVAGAGVPVYAIVARLSGAESAADEQNIASDYGVPVEAVRAALAYYRQHRFLIDAWNAMNAE